MSEIMSEAVTEPRAHKIKRLHMRSIRRGIKEMDLILTVFAQQRLPHLEDAALDLYDSLQDESDHDLYQWVTGQAAAPAHFDAMIQDIRQTFSPQV